MNFRQYQNVFIRELAIALTEYRKVLGQLATGGGKTFIFSSISHKYHEKSGKRVLILVHRKELLKQTRRTAYNSFKLDCQPITAGMKYIPPADVYVGMVETVDRLIKKRGKKIFGDVGLVIIDECHVANFNKIHEHFLSELILGFTATALSSSKKKPLNLYYDTIICGADIPILIAQKHLSQNITWAPKDVVDRRELEMKGDDFDEGQMAVTFSKSKYVNNTVYAYEKWCKNEKTIIFNVNIDHSKVVCDAFVAAGYNCKHLDSTMDKERDQILMWFHNTPGAILCNVGIATTGFDEPTIEAVIVNRATMSMPLWIQMCGRGSRAIDDLFIEQVGKSYTYELSPKFSFKIIDMGGNAVIHGDWCQARDWIDIFHNPPKPGKPTAAPMKTCPQCDGIVPAPTKQCRLPVFREDGTVGECGYVWPSSDIKVEEELYEFVMITKGIDVQQIINDNAHRKLYYPFFQIGRQLAEDAQKTIPKMSDEYFTFILNKYHDLAREWCHKNNKRFNEWHRLKAGEILLEKIKTKFPEWETTLAYTTELET